MTEIYSLIKSKINRANVLSPDMLELLSRLSLAERERLARETETRVVYLGDEVPLVRAAEEQAVLKAAPPGYPLEALNGANIGCGDRLIHPCLIPVDISRTPLEMAPGNLHPANAHALLATAEDLPFARGHLDFIIAVHTLEHVADPINVVKKWLKLVKPGGGIGLTLPDWRYNWDALHDASVFGHKWDPTPTLLRRIWETHWSDSCALEAIATYPYKISFDVILRVPGTFSPFSIDQLKTAPCGNELAGQDSVAKGDAALFPIRHTMPGYPLD